MGALFSRSKKKTSFSRDISGTTENETGDSAVFDIFANQLRFVHTIIEKMKDELGRNDLMTEYWSRLTYENSANPYYVAYLLQSYIIWCGYQSWLPRIWAAAMDQLLREQDESIQKETSILTYFRADRPRPCGTSIFAPEQQNYAAVPAAPGAGTDLFVTCGQNHAITLTNYVDIMAAPGIGDVIDAGRCIVCSEWMYPHTFDPLRKV